MRKFTKKVTVWTGLKKAEVIQEVCRDTGLDEETAVRAIDSFINTIDRAMKVDDKRDITLTKILGYFFEDEEQEG